MHNNNKGTKVSYAEENHEPRWTQKYRKMLSSNMGILFMISTNYCEYK